MAPLGLQQQAGNVLHSGTLRWGRDQNQGQNVKQRGMANIHTIITVYNIHTIITAYNYSPLKASFLPIFCNCCFLDQP